MIKHNCIKNRLRHFTGIIMIFVLLLASCNKYLDVKPDKSLEVPANLADFQAILDSKIVSTIYPFAGTIASDDYFLPFSVYQTFTPDLQHTYTWSSVAYNDLDWNYSYKIAADANVVLDGLKSTDLTPGADYNNVKGSALFIRGFCYYEAANIFALPYNSANSNTTPGIPLKLTGSITDKITRPSLEADYQQVLSDLKAAAALLPVTPKVKTRPSKPAAYGALARVCLEMGDYQSAYNYSDSCLQLYNTLIDYNTVSAASPNPFPLFNDEVIFHATVSGTGGLLSSASANVDSVLYSRYAGHDLRRSIFYAPADSDYYAFRGDYGGSIYGNVFNGIATDEVLLIRAETSIRLGRVAQGIGDLNTLLKNRFVTGNFIAYSTAMDSGDALTLLLGERRKELAFRGELRWEDLRRLNLDSRFAKTLVRNLNGTIFTLPPNDKRYAYLLPLSVIQVSGIAQNTR